MSKRPRKSATLEEKMEVIRRMGGGQSHPTLFLGFKYGPLHCNVTYLLKARTVEQEKQQLLGNRCVTHNNGVTV
jgi:hypothetical protein